MIISLIHPSHAALPHTRAGPAHRRLRPHRGRSVPPAKFKPANRDRHNYAHSIIATYLARSRILQPDIPMNISSPHPAPARRCGGRRCARAPSRAPPCSVHLHSTPCAVCLHCWPHGWPGWRGAATPEVIILGFIHCYSGNIPLNDATSIDVLQCRRCLRILCTGCSFTAPPLATAALRRWTTSDSPASTVCTQSHSFAQSFHSID